MYTATLLGDSSNKELSRRIITVEFSNGTHVFQKDFQFSLNQTVEVMKRTVKQYLGELNVPVASITDLTPAPENPTQDEIDKQTWVEDWQNLQAANKLAANGVNVLTSAQLTALKNKVQTTWKASYRDVV